MAAIDGTGNPWLDQYTRLLLLRLALGPESHEHPVNGDKLRRLRLARFGPNSRATVAKRVGVNYYDLLYAEDGEETSMPYEVIQHMAWLYEVGVEELLDQERKELYETSNAAIHELWQEALEWYEGKDHPGLGIRRAREYLGASQEDLSKTSGVGRDSISKIETRAVDPRPGTLAKLNTGLDKLRAEMQPDSLPFKLPPPEHGGKLWKSAEYWARHYVEAWGLSSDLKHDICFDALVQGYADATRGFDPDHPGGASFGTYADYKVRDRAKRAAVQLSSAYLDPGREVDDEGRLVWDSTTRPEPPV